MVCSGDNLPRLRRLLLALGVVVLCLPAQASAGTLFVIDGRGWGHGVGMSQYGARGYAEAGWGYQRILAHYYRGTELRIVPARPVRVLLAERLPAVQISSTKPFKVVDARGKVRRLKAGHAEPRRGEAARSCACLCATCRAPRRCSWTGRPTVVRCIVHRQAGKLTIVNRLPLDRYLRGVVPWEMPDDWQREALRAQSVVARSYALATLKPGALFDLYADTRSQVYGGIRAEAASTNRAIGSTAGRVLSWNGRVATTFYHSTSGGRTVSNDEAWPGATPVPYLVSVSDPYDGLSKLHRWGPFRWTPAEVGRKLGVGVVRDLVVSRGPSGRAAEVTIKGRSGVRTMLAQDFRRALDLRSTWFAVRVLNLEQPRGRALAVAGRPVVLKGFVRGLGKVRLEQQVNGGTWTNSPACACSAGRALHGQGRPEAGDELPPRDAARRRRGRHRQPSLTSSLHGLTRPSRRSGYRRLHETAASSRDGGRGVPRVLCARRRLAVRPLRASGRCVARVRAGNARRADRRARPDRRRPRPLHDQLARGREGPREEELGERGRGSRRTERPRDRTGRDALRRSALGKRRPCSELGAEVGLDLRGVRRRGREPLPWVKLWLVWNEPNQRRWLRPTTPQTYVTKLLNPAYARNPQRDPGREGRRRRHRSTRLDRRRLPGRLDPRYGRRGRAPGCLRAQPVSAQALRDTLDRRLRALRDDHDVDARAAAARGVARLRPAQADLADGVRLPDEPAGSCCSASPRRCRPAT